LRPGRFDRRVVIDLPDINDREAILKLHAKGKPLEGKINLRKLAERTPGFSGADLANIMNEGAILAARENKEKIEEPDLLDAVEKVMLGPERKSHILSKKEKKVTAYHEAGHALVAHLSKNSDPVHKVSVISRGFAAGYTIKVPTEDRKMHTKAEFMDDIAVALGGYTAEMEIFGDLTTGASNDLQVATGLAKKMVMNYGMSESVGPRTLGEHQEMIFMGKGIHSQRDYSEKVAEQIDEEVSKLMRHGHEQAKRIINESKGKLESIVAVLMDKETIEKEDFEKLMRGEKLDEPEEKKNDSETDQTK